MGSVACIVDGYSSAKYYPLILGGLGFELVHVRSQENLSQFYRNPKIPVHYKDYTTNIQIEQTAEWLRRHHVTKIICGADSGVEVAEHLTQRLGLDGNNSKTLPWRVNKHAMYDRLRELGIPHIDYFASDRKDALLDWCRQHEFKVVIKPNRSTGLNGIRICSTSDQVSEGYDETYGVCGFYGDPQDEVLVQKTVSAPEFSVNTVSVGGKHRLVEFWKIFRKDGEHPNVDYMHTVEGHELGKPAIEYLTSVLDGLGVVDGPSHIEIFLLKDDEPRLIELNARLHGDLDLKSVTRATGSNQALEYCRSFISPDWHMTRPLIDTGHGRMCCRKLLASGKAGVLSRGLDFESLRGSAGTFSGHIDRTEPGKKITRTHSIGSSLGAVFYVGDMDAIHKDMDATDRWLERELDAVLASG